MELMVWSWYVALGQTNKELDAMRRQVRTWTERRGCPMITHQGAEKSFQLLLWGEDTNKGFVYLSPLGGQNGPSYLG